MQVHKLHKIHTIHAIYFNKNYLQIHFRELWVGLQTIVIEVILLLEGDSLKKTFLDSNFRGGAAAPLPPVLYAYKCVVKEGTSLFLNESVFV